MEFFIQQIKKLEMNKYKIYTALWILFGVLMVFRCGGYLRNEFRMVLRIFLFHFVYNFLNTW